MRLIDADALIEGANEALGRFKAEKTVQMLRFHKSMIEDAPTIERLDWTPCADGLPTNPNVACSLTVYNDDIFGEPQIVLLPWYAAYNSEIKQWVTADGVEVEEEVLAWMPCPEHYRADDTTGKVKED